MIPDNHMNYVNHEMDHINNLVAELYEAMADNENADVISCCNKLGHRLSEIKKDYRKDVE